MKNNYLGTLLIVALFAGVPTLVKAADEEQARKPHDQFKRLVGDWTTEMKSFFPDPDAPKVTKGRASFKMILGGNFVQQKFFGEVEGKKYEGIGISGYDTAKKKYIGTWKDSLNTGIMHTEGTYDVKSHTLTELGEMSSPSGTMKTKNQTKYIDQNNFVFTMYMITPDGEQKIFSINYTRAKDDRTKKEENQ